MAPPGDVKPQVVSPLAFPSSIGGTQRGSLGVRLGQSPQESRARPFCPLLLPRQQEACQTLPRPAQLDHHDAAWPHGFCTSQRTRTLGLDKIVRECRKHNTCVTSVLTTTLGERHRGGCTSRAASGEEGAQISTTPSTRRPCLEVLLHVAPMVLGRLPHREGAQVRSTLHACASRHDTPSHGRPTPTSRVGDARKTGRVTL